MSNFITDFNSAAGEHDAIYLFAIDATPPGRDQFRIESATVIKDDFIFFTV